MAKKEEKEEVKGRRAGADPEREESWMAELDRQKITLGSFLRIMSIL